MPISKKLTKTINAKKTVSTKKTKVIPKVKKAVSSKKIPAFKTEAEERVFWQKNDSSDYIDWSKARPARFVNLKPRQKLFQFVCRKLYCTILKCSQIVKISPINL